MTKICDLPVFEKPREKAFHYGVRSLSNAELLALLLRTGTREYSSVEVAESLLKQTRGIAGVARCTLQELAQEKGIGMTKGLEILAAIELNRRIAYEDVVYTDVLNNPRNLVHWLQAEIGSSLQETFLVVYLDTQNRLVSYKPLFKGTINVSSVYPREIFKEAFLNNSSSILLVHNHPSGSITPSDADYVLTKRIATIGRWMEIEVVDHIIVSNNRFFSFATEGILRDIVEDFYKEC